MVRFGAAMFCIVAVSQCTFGDEPTASCGRVHSQSTRVQTKNCDRGCQPARENCPENVRFPFFEDRSKKLADLGGRATQLSQHIPYESPMEDSYFFRPYQISEVTRQSRSGRDPKNPYDNRFLQSIYKQPVSE